MTTLTRLLAVLAVAAALAPAQDKELQTLKQQMSARYPTLLRLENEGKVGETWDGKVGVVNAAVQNERIDPKGDETIAGLLAKENQDRSRVYELLAKQQNVGADAVAAEAGKRAFRNAQPEHFLKPKDGKWVKRKEAKIE